MMTLAEQFKIEVGIKPNMETAKNLLKMIFR